MASANRPRRRGCRVLLLALVLVLRAPDVLAHDPSAWGGLFRTRDRGETWFAASSGSFSSGAIALAINPVDTRQLLLAAESGVLRSRNAGRDWEVEAPDVLIGPAFGVVYGADGQRVLVSMASAIFRSHGDGWRTTRAPAGATPARALSAGSVPGRVYLAGWSGLYRSDDWGNSWANVAEGLPEEPITALVVAPGYPELVYVTAGGRLWVSFDEANHWQRCDVGLPSGRVEALTLDVGDSARVWAVAQGQVWFSEDRGQRWRPIGQSLPDRNISVRGIVISSPVIVLATDRGLYRSPDGGERWQLLGENLPAHLEAGPLARDPVSPSVFYAGFALTPYEELRRQAADGRTGFTRLSVTDLAGGAAFLILLMLSAVVAARRLAHSHYQAPIRAPRLRGRRKPPDPVT